MKEQLQKRLKELQIQASHMETQLEQTRTSLLMLAGAMHEIRQLIETAEKEDATTEEKEIRAV
jgi:hypothetical protein